MRLSTRKYLTDEEHQQLTTRLKNLIPYDKRNAALVALALHSGARAGELIRIRHEDLEDQTKTVYIKGIKNSYDRQVPLPDWLFELLQTLPKHSPLLFNLTDTSSIRRIWYTIRTTKKPFHSLRHTKAIRILKKTKDFLIVKTYLGHKSESSTNVYISHLTDLDHLRQGLEE